MTKIFAIDLSNIGYILDNSGQVTRKGLLDFGNGLRRQLGVRKYVILDDSKPYFRKIFYPEYKAHRKEREKGYKARMEALRKNNPDIICGIPRLEVDDMMGVLARRDGLAKFVAVASDGDFKQLNIFRKFSQLSPLTRNYVAGTQKSALEGMIVKILKGDPKDNIKKCHNEKQIRTKKLQPVLENVFRKIREAARGKRGATITDIPLREFIWEEISSVWDVDEVKFGINFDLNCLIQPCYEKYMGFGDIEVMAKILEKIQH